ncbi:hypothetical protein GCM10027167_86650 [Nocardia heshunensis]
MILVATGAAAACSSGPRVTVDNAASGSVSWEHKVEGSVRGVRYGDDRTGTVAVESDTGVTGLKAENGQQAWQLPIATSGIGRGSCFWNGAFVVCGTEPGAPVQRALALDAVTGERKWSFDALEGVALEGAFGVRDQVLYLTASGPDKGTREVWAVDMRTKSVKWQVPGDADGLTVPDTDSLLYARGSGGDLTALDLGTGATVWSHTGDSGNAPGSALVDGAVLTVDGAHSISGLDPKTGAALWNTTVSAYPADAVFGSGDTYYLYDGAKLHAMRPGGDAAPLWTLTVADANAAAKVAGYAVPGACYLLAAGNLRAIHPQTSRIRWMHTIPDKDGAAVQFSVGPAHCYVESEDSTALVAVMR